MSEDVPIGFRGDPAFGERQFVDPGPWQPPRYTGLLHDPFFVEARTYADVAAEEAANSPAGVATPNVEPGVSEFGYGRGLMAYGWRVHPDIDGHDVAAVDAAIVAAKADGAQHVPAR